MARVPVDVSVILPVYDGEAFLRDSIDSVLRQENVNLELVIVDDSSNDSSRDIVASVGDDRVVVRNLEANGGLANALNVGIDMARGSLIARQDQDDLSHPLRLWKQRMYLHAHPDVVVLGTWATVVRPSVEGSWVRAGEHRHPTMDDELRVRLLWNNPFVHSSVMMRRDVFRSSGGYGTDPLASWPEDFDLWSRMALYGRLANLPEFLVEYRETPGGMSRAESSQVRKGVSRIAVRNMAQALCRSDVNGELVEIVDTLNGQPAGNTTARGALGRVLIFWRACGSARRGGRGLYGMRLRWSFKLLARTLRPIHR